MILNWRVEENLVVSNKGNGVYLRLVAIGLIVAP